MKRVLFLTNHDVGLYNFRLELIKRLILERYEVFISSPYGERIEDLKRIGCKFIGINLVRHGTNPIVEMKLISYYKKLLKEVKPDIVFSYTIKPNIYGGIACKSLDVPCIVNITGLGTAVENGGIMQKFIVLLYKFAFANVQRVFFQNTENMDFFIKHKIAIGKHDLLPGSGVNLQYFVPFEYPNDDIIKFAFISRIMKEKGIEQYISAAKIIKKKYPNTEFHVCGFCEQAYEYQLDKLQKQGIIRYHGRLQDVRTILKDIHCTIHPTYYPEGLSNVLLESSACARPIITTNRSGCREVIDDGVNGYIVEQQNCFDLIDKVEKFIALSYEEKMRMGLAGRAKVEIEFDRNVVVDKYVEEANIVDYYE